MVWSRANIIKIALTLFISTTFISCQNKTAPGSGGADLGGMGGGGDFNGTLDTGGSTPGSGGSGPAGILTDSDKTALKNVVAAAEDPNLKANPGDATIPAELQAQIDQMLKDQKAGKDVTIQKMMLAGKLLQVCAGKVTKYVPVPGQPLMGGWKGTGTSKGQEGDPDVQCPIDFQVNGPGTGQVYPVSGGVQGQLGAYPDGRFEIRGTPFQGGGQDSGYQGGPLSGVGTLTNPNFSRGKYTSECKGPVELVSPSNPIPPNFNAAVKAAGSCYRKAITLISMSEIFAKMPPQLAQMLQQRILGGDDSKSGSTSSSGSGSCSGGACQSIIHR